MSIDEVNKLQMELIQELKGCSIEELRELRILWESELIRLGRSQCVINYCNTIVDLVIEKKLKYSTKSQSE